MADSKYGRLFTENDVQRLVSATMGIVALALREGREPPDSSAKMLAEAIAVTEPARLTFPPDEPLFLLRGQDAATPDTIAAYATRVVELGGAGAHTRDVGARYIAVRDWQINHPDRVKVPDS